jgi:23S rRNA (guanosine2251-2'-O)-methyltransferase
MTKKQHSDHKVTGELIFGIHPVIELLRAKKRKLISIYTTKPTPKGFADIEKLMPKYPVQIQYVSRDVLHRMVDSTDHQGVVAWVAPFPFRTKPFTPDKHQFLIMLDGLQDPRNVGAILRSAYCTGVQGVIICRKNASPLTATALKSSAGLGEHLDIYQTPSAQAAVQELAQAGYHLYVTAFNGVNAASVEYKTPLCVIIGSEGEGVSKQIMAAGTKITIPQKEAAISYNASVAAGILLFIVASQKKYIGA